MIKACNNAVGLIFLLTCSMVMAQQPADKPLPKVLIIGDAVYQQFVHAGVAKDLKDKATVQLAKWPSGVHPCSSGAIQCLDILLGIKDITGKEVPQAKQTNWDLIHFNVGLGDMVHGVPNLKSHRSLPYDVGGVVRTPLLEYEKNLDELVVGFKQAFPKAKIVWANTTPIRHSESKIYKPGSEIEYNQVAAAIMKKHGVTINDMHKVAESIMNMDKPNRNDPYFFDNHPLHSPVAATIARELGALIFMKEGVLQ
jgi:hypothetical protein